MNNRKIRVVLNKVNSNDVLESDLELAPDGFFEEVFVNDILEISKNDNILFNIANKVRKNGTLKLSGVDGAEMCRKVSLGDVNITDASKNFFSKVNRINSVNSLRDFLSNGWNIVFLGLSSDGRYFVEATRV